MCNGSPYPGTYSEPAHGFLKPVESYNRWTIVVNVKKRITIAWVLRVTETHFPARPARFQRFGSHGLVYPSRNAPWTIDLNKKSKWGKSVKMSDFRLLTKLNRKICIYEAEVPGQYGTWCSHGWGENSYFNFRVSKNILFYIKDTNKSVVGAVDVWTKSVPGKTSPRFTVAF